MIFTVSAAAALAIPDESRGAMVTDLELRRAPWAVVWSHQCCAVGGLETISTHSLTVLATCGGRDAPDLSPGLKRRALPPINLATPPRVLFNRILDSQPVTP